MIHPEVFPTGISYRSRGGPGFKTDIIELDAGAEQRVLRWPYPRHRYDARYGVRTHDDLYAVKKFYIARQGSAFGFYWFDHLDHASTANGRAPSTIPGGETGIPAPADTDILLGQGDGGTKIFQLIKPYTSGATTVNRIIQHPISGSVVVSLDDVPQPTGWSVSTTTGQITFTTAVPNAVDVKAGFKFYVPVRFASEIDGLLSVSMDAFKEGSIPSIPIVELVSEKPVREDLPRPGGIRRQITEDQQLGIEAQVYEFDVQAANLSAILPEPSTLGSGKDYYTIINSTASGNTITVRDDTGIAVGNPIPIGGSGSVHLLRDETLALNLWVNEQ